MTDIPSHKFCSQCGTPNNRTAKVCVQCGHRFSVAALDAVPADALTSGNPLGATEKSCPQCGTINKLSAKVCIQCGYHFQGQSAQDSESSPSLEIGELPISQNPEPPLSLPQQFEFPPTPALPPVSKQPASNLNKLEGEVAPDLGSEELDELREESSENDLPYERLQRSLQRKQRKS